MVFVIVFIIFYLGAVAPNPIAVFLSAFSLLAFGLLTLSNIFLTDNERLAELFISTIWNAPDSWLVIIHTALFFMPVILLLKRGAILTKIVLRWRMKLSKKNKRKILPAFISIVIITMIVQIIIPFRGIPPDRRFITQVLPSANNDVLSLLINDMTFLDSRIITFNLGARGNPVRFDVSLESGNALSLLPVYSAPVPFDRVDGGRRVIFSLGEDPPNPLVLEIVLPQNFAGLLRAEAIYNIWDPDLDPDEKPGTDDYILRVSRVIELGSTNGPNRR